MPFVKTCTQDYAKCEWPEAVAGPEGQGGLQLAAWADALNDLRGFLQIPLSSGRAAGAPLLAFRRGTAAATPDVGSSLISRRWSRRHLLFTLCTRPAAHSGEAVLELPQLGAHGCPRLISGGSLVGRPCPPAMAFVSPLLPYRSPATKCASTEPVLTCNVDEGCGLGAPGREGEAAAAPGACIWAHTLCLGCHSG